MIALFAIQFVSANGNNISITQNQNLCNPPLQGGKLEFGSTSIERFERSTDNSDYLYLNDYCGRPLKALQLKIVIGNSNLKLVLKSLSRGSSIPDSSFLFDYEIHRGNKDNNGNPTEVINVVILGNGYNALEPGSNYNLFSINYDIVDMDQDSIITTISLQDVMGATSSPVEDANIVTGKDEIIYLRKNTVEEEIKINLNQNYPNPFNPNTKISWQSQIGNWQTLIVFDALGNEVAKLVDEYRPAGYYEIEFNAASVKSGLSSGIYYYMISTGENVILKKMIYLK